MRVVEKLGLSLSFMLQFKEGHFLSAGEVVCGSQVVLVQAVGSIITQFESPRIIKTFIVYTYCQLTLLLSLSVWPNYATYTEHWLLHV